jgi:tetratricopeptide (TPR) repeat protein
MPGWTRMLERRARAARAAGDAKTAEQELRALIAEAVDLETRDRARGDLIQVLLERQRYAEAARIYVDTVGSRGPERRTVSLEAFVPLVGDPRAARAAVSGATVPSELGGELHRLAAELAGRAGDDANLVRELELAHDVTPADPEILERLAQIERQTERLDRAIAHYREGSEHEPRRAAPLTGWVAALRQAGQLDAALDTGRTPSRERPTDPDAWALTGTVLGLAGFTREGCDARQRAHELAPERASFSFDLAVCLEDLGGGAEPVAMLEKLLAAGSGGAPWQRTKVLERLRGAYTARAKRAAWSARVLALAADPATVDRPGLLADAAALLVRSGDVAEASTLYDKLVAQHGTDPRWAESALALADVEVERGRAARAQELWRMVIARNDLAAEWGVTASLALGESLRVRSAAPALEEWDRCAVRHAAVAPGARCRLRRARALADLGRAGDAASELVKLLANPARDVETTRGALSQLATTTRKDRP